MNLASNFILIAVALFATVNFSFAQDAATKGLQIATEAKKRDTG